MGQKVHPKGYRLGIYSFWDANWFAKGNSYGKFLQEDLEIRKLINAVVESSEISRVEIEKAEGNIRITIHSGAPGAVIGKRGQGIDSLKNAIATKLKKTNVEITVQEVKKPELDALLVAKNIAAQLEKRGSYKKAMKRATTSAMRSGARGVKMCCSGRLQGAEIARTEWARMGSIPLHTLRADVDYGFAEAKTTFGIIGVKVWIYKGEFQNVYQWSYDKKELNHEIDAKKN